MKIKSCFTNPKFRVIVYIRVPVNQLEKINMSGVDNNVNKLGKRID